MTEEDWIIVIVIGIAVLAVVGIISGFTNSIENMLMSAGASAAAASQIGSFLFFGILLLIIIGVGRRLL